MKKKRSEATQTLRADCGKAEPKILAPPQTPSRGSRNAKIKSAGDGHYLFLQTQFGDNRCTQFRVIVVTDPPTHKHRYRQDRLQYTAPQLARSVKIVRKQTKMCLFSPTWQEAVEAEVEHNVVNIWQVEVVSARKQRR